jgi:hypothetical protein
MRIESRRACGSCGEGYLEPTNIRGMKLEHRDDRALRIPADLVLPVCDRCGDMALNREQTVALEYILERAYARKRLRLQRALINDLRRCGITQGQIEQFAELSQGYVSKLRMGKLAGGRTFKMLYLLHEMPEAALRTISRVDPRLRHVCIRKPTLKRVG